MRLFFRDVMRILCIFSFLSFLDTLFLYFRSCDHFYIYIVLIFFVYIDVCFFHLPLTCVGFFFSLFIHMFLTLVCNLLFMFHKKMP